MGELGEDMRIGIPRSLLYHRYGVLWHEFLGRLGCELVVSPPTNLAIVEQGSRLAPDEACLPLKIHIGHVAALEGKVDAVLVPRVVTVRKREENCVRLAATRDIVANILPDVPLLSYTVDVCEGLSQRRAMRRFAASLGNTPMRSALAYERARLRQWASERAAAREARRSLRSRSDAPCVLVVGHAYNLEDALVGAPLLRMLAEAGLGTVSADALRKPRRSKRSDLSSGVYWTYNRELMEALARVEDHIDGVVFLATFPCGPDSLVTELAIRRMRDLPVLNLVLDDLQAQTGLQTRVEGFADIVRMRCGIRRGRASA